MKNSMSLEKSRNRYNTSMYMTNGKFRKASFSSSSNSKNYKSTELKSILKKDK